jgi:hypothetical protein
MDMSLVEWHADVAAHRKVRPSFVPSPPDSRASGAHPLSQDAVDARVTEIQRLEKLIEEAGISHSPAG